MTGWTRHDGTPHLTPLNRLVKLLRPEWGDIAIAGLFSAVVGVLTLATPLAVEALVNTVSFGRLVQPLVVLAIILFAFLAFGAALKTLQVYVAELIQRRIFVRVVADLATRLPRVDRRAFDGQHAPELLNRFFDVMTVQKSAALLVLDGMTIVLKATIGLAVLAFYHPLLLGFDMFLLGLLCFVVFVLGRGAVSTAIRESRAKYAVAAWLEELAQNSNTFRGQGGGDHALRRADDLTGEYLDARSGHFRIVLRQAMFAFGMQAASGSILLGLGGWLVMQGKINLGQLVAAELIVAVLVDAFAKLNKHAESFYDLLAAIDKIGHLLDLPCERGDGDPLPPSDVGVEIRLRRVSCGTEHPRGGVRSVDLHVAPGEIVALDGAEGASASLLLDLLFASRPVEEGSATIDGADLRTLDPRRYREQVALVRDIEIFSGTLADNVRLDREHVDAAAIRAALGSVGLWERTLEMSQGVEMPLQPSSDLLTADEVRRLMLARALVGAPRLLLVDGLLDALSDATLPRILEVLESLRPRCTVVIVTGREDIRERCRPLALGGPPDDRDSPNRSPDDSNRSRHPVLGAA